MYCPKYEENIWRIFALDTKMDQINIYGTILYELVIS